MRRSLLNKPNLLKSLRQALVLFTLLILPTTAWGQITVAGNAPDQNGNISGDGITGSVTFASTGDNSGTLTLNNATINGTIVLDNTLLYLIVDIIGTNTIQATNSAVIRRTNNEKWSAIWFTSSTKTGSLTLENIGGNSDEGLLYYIEPNSIEPNPIEPSIKTLTPKFEGNSGWSTATKAEIKALGLTVAGVTVTTGNNTDILDGDNTEKVSFTLAEGTNPATLTLNGATLGTIDESLPENNNLVSIVSELDALTINLQGKNKLYGTITGSLENATLAFTGYGSLEISGESDSPISAFTSVNFGDFNLASQSAPGIHWESYEQSQGGSLRGFESEARDVTITKDTYYPIWIYDSSLASNAYASHTQLKSDKLSVAVGNGTVSFDDGNHTITINGASINSGSNKMIVVGPDMPELTVHLVGASTGTNDATILGLWNTTQLTFTTDESKAGSLTAPIIVSWHEGSGQISCENGLVYNSEANPQTISTTGVRLKIGNTEVSASGSITTIDGASFDATTNTLTLTGATITEAIASNVNLTIVINGENSITSSAGVALMSNDGNLTLTFQKGGEGASLRLTSSDSNNGVISAFKSVTADGMRIMGINATDNSTYKATYDSSSKTLVGENKQPVTDATISSFLDGQGTEASPYLIKTAADLASVSDWVNNGTLTTEYLQLANDIDCSSLSDFTPIGTNSNYSFAGSFDGNNKTISGLNCTPSGGDAGLFGSVGNANISSTIIKNLNLDHCTFNGADAGAIAITLNNGIIQGCHVTSSSVTSHQQSPKAGGIVASLGNGSIEGCSVSESTVTGKQENSGNNGVSYAGGIAGSTSGGSINNCEVTNVNIISSHIETNGSLGSGGIVGHASSTTITNNTVGGTTTVTCEDKYSEVENYTNAGAIVGYHLSGCTFNSNTYESSVKTITKEYDNTEETKEGQTQRGIGNESDEIGKIELAGTKTVTIYVPDVVGNGGCSEVAGTYYKFVEPNYYVLSGTNFTYSMKPTSGYKPTFTLSDNTIEVTANEVEVNEAYDHTEFTFTMPDANLTATLSFLSDLSSDSYTATIEDATYTGAAQSSQAVSLSLNDGAITPFTLDTHYTIDGYKDADKQALESAPKNVGTYYATIKGVEANGFTGSKDVQFNITKANLDIVTIEAIPNQTYSGSEIEPKITVTLNDEEVATDDNFTIAYSNNTNVSTATVRGTVTLTALATSECFTEGTTKIATFVIIPKSIEGVTVTLSGDGFDSEKNCFVYNGQNQTPTVTVMDGERLLTLDTDYTLTNNGGVGVANDYSVTVTGMGNYRDDTSIDVTYSITPKSIAGVTISLDPEATYVYDGDEKTPIPEVKDGETVLTLNTDYTISYSNNTNAATSTAENAPTIIITGKGNYDETTTATATFTINQADLQDAAISKIAFGGKEYTVGNLIEIPYTGEAIQPTVEEVKISDGTVTVDASDYNVSYSNNTEISSDDNLALIIITSTGKNFTEGTSTSQGFKIVRATVTITAENQTVTYNADKQEYDISKVEVSNNNAKLAITYYAKEEDRSKGENALTEAPTNADTYYVRVTLNEESQQHYVANPADATFTVDQLELTNAEITLDNTELTYNGEAQTVSVTKVKVGELVVPTECYEVSDNTATEAGTHTAVVTAKTTNADGSTFKNNFKGSATVDWKINHRTASAAELGFTSETQTASTYYNRDEAFNLPEGYVGYIVTGTNGTNVLTTRVSYIQKGVAVLVEKGSSSANAIDEAPDPANLPLKGTSELLEVSSIVGGTVYVLYNGEFVKSTSGKIPAKRCYLLIESSVAAGTRAFGINHNKGANGIESALFDDNDVKADDKWFDLQGRRIEKPTKAGIYVVNGKKVMINNK